MESHIGALYYYDMYKSAALWKTCNDVYNGMSSLKSISSQEHALRKTIIIIVAGFGWTEFSHVWSKNGVKYAPSELALHLKKVIRA